MLDNVDFKLKKLEIGLKMQITKYLDGFDWDKRSTYKWLTLSSLMVLCVLYGYVSQISSNYPNGTTLNASDLLVLAGLTITFYTLLEQVVDRLLGKKEKYYHLKEYLSAVILVNIIVVAVSIFLILISTLGKNGLKNVGFGLLASSWAYNIIILFISFFANYIENILEKKKFRIAINIVLVIVFWISFITVLLIVMGYTLI